MVLTTSTTLRRAALALLAVLATGGAVALTLAGQSDALLALTPFLALLVLMIVRPYAGERLLRRFRARPRRRASRLVVTPAAPLAARFQSCLIALSLAGRAPPHLAGSQLR